MMTDNAHDRALELIVRARVEGMPEADSNWLRGHLEECDFCAEHARHTDRALRLLRTAAIPLPDGLASRAQFHGAQANAELRRLRAMELREREPAHRALWFACAISWAFGIASAPYVWRLFAWFGERTGVPKLVWELGFGLWWTIPALFAAAVLLIESLRKSEPADWINQGS